MNIYSRSTFHSPVGSCVLMASIVDCWPRCRSSVNWVSTKVSRECRSRTDQDVDRGYMITGINWHSTPDAFRTHNPSILWFLTCVCFLDLPFLGQLNFQNLDSHLHNISPKLNHLEQTDIVQISNFIFYYRRHMFDLQIWFKHVFTCKVLVRNRTSYMASPFRTRKFSNFFIKKHCGYT